MPSYAELNKEKVWRDQFVPPSMNVALILPLRVLYSLGATSIGAPGDNYHLSGRHRSYNWDKYSQYSVNRTYGTTAARDQGGDLNWYRAVDIGISGQPLWDACRRLDAAVRAGQLPCVAEWFGTFDGKTVVGWFQGSAASSDSSHLTHGHIGFWNDAANDPVQMQRVYDVWTGTAGPPAPANRRGTDVLTLIVQPTNGQGIGIAWPSERIGSWIFTNIVPPGASIDATTIVDAYKAVGCVDARSWAVPSWHGYVNMADAPGEVPPVVVGDVTAVVGAMTGTINLSPAE